MKLAFRRNLAILLSAVLLVTCVPVNAYAEIPEQAEAQTEGETIIEEAESPAEMADTETIAETEEVDINEDEPLTEAPETEMSSGGWETLDGTLSDTPSGTASETPDVFEAIEPTPSEAGYIILEAEAEDGMGVTLTADEDAFGTSEGLELVAEIASGSEAEKAGKEIDKETGAENVARRVTYDIRVEKDGEEVQPLEGKQVKVEFHLHEVPSGADEVTIYHHDEEEGLEVIAEKDITGATQAETAGKGDTQAAEEEAAGEDTLTEEELEEYEDTELINDLTAEGETDSFSLYTVDFTYEDKKVSLKGDTVKNPLAEILEEVGITDPVTGVEVYQDDKFSDISGDGAVRNGDTVLFRVYEEEGTWYVDAVNPFTSTHGIIVKTEDADYRVVVTDEGATDNLLTFTAVDEDSSVTFDFGSGSAKYSTDGGKNWTDYPKNTKISLKAGESVKFAGTNVKTDNYHHFSMTGKIEASGDVTSLTNGVGGDASLTASCYQYMFYDCKSLITGPNLPSTTLAHSCYKNMFSACPSLTEVTGSIGGAFGDYCCDSMFFGCRKLATAPEIQATSMGTNACIRMFYYCTSLTEVPGSLGGEFSDNCCQGMFYDCKNLISAPSISATKLGTSCCRDMFYGCTSLTEVTGSIGGAFGDYCCDSMFFGCRKLATAPEIQATSMGTNACIRMFYYCTSLTEVPGSLGGEFSDNCCQGMFYDCKNLISAPSISATKLGTSCCRDMFYGCTSLIVHSMPDENGIELSFSGTGVSGWNNNMFYGCSLVDLDGSNSKIPETDKTYYITAKAVPYLSGISATEITYGQALSKSTVSGTAKYAGKSVAGTWSFSTPSIVPQVNDSNVTEYGVVFSPDDPGMHAASYGKTKLKVNPAPIGYTVSDSYIGAYDGNSHSVAVTVTKPSSGYTVQYSIDGGSRWTDGNSYSAKDVADSKTVEFRIEAPNHATVSETRNVTVTRKTVTVKAEDKIKTYGDADPVLTATVSGTVGTDTVSYSIARETGEDADTYTVTPSGAASQGNYHVTYETGTLTIGQKAVTVKAEDKSKTYGEADPVLTATVSGTLGTDNVIYSLARNAGENTGTYTVTPSGAESQGNYHVTYKTGKLKINQKEVTVKAEDKAKTYGNADPVLTATVSGTLGTDTVIYSLARNAGENAGTYTITPSGAESQGNYHVTYKTGKLKINQKEVTVKAEDKAKTYGNADPIFTATVSGTLGTDTVSYSFSRDAGEDVGTYTITPTGAASQGNYHVTYIPGTLTVNQRAVTVTADDKYKIHFEADPVLTARVSGTVGSDTVSYSVSRDPGEDVATYSITPYGAASQGNYHVTYVDGVFTIHKCAYEVKFDMQGHGGQVATQSVIEGGMASRPANPYETGYTFGGWYREADCENLWVFERDTVDSDTTIYAKWSKQSAKAEWTEAPSQIGTAANPLAGGRWINHNGVWIYTVERDMLRNALAWITYTGADKKTYTGRFLFDIYGCMATGWRKIDGAWYYFNTVPGPTYGMMLINTKTPDGYMVGADGKWIQ